MIVFPFGFCKTKYPGYYWQEDEQKLYSIKSGVLKPLALQKPWRTRFGHIGPHYAVSVAGIKRYLTVEQLKKIRYPDEDQVVDVAPLEIDSEGNLKVRSLL